MKKYYGMLLGLVAVLILFDQGSKLIISNYYTVEDNILMVSNTVHIHPILNDRCVVQYLKLATETNIHLYFWLVSHALKTAVSLLLPVVLAIFARKFFFWDKKVKNYPMLLMAMMCFIIAGILCHVLDDFVWGGSFDFICISWDDSLDVNGVLHNIVRHKSFDIKDFYLYTGKILLIIRGMFELLVYIQNKDTVSDRMKHPIMNLHALKQYSKKDK